MLTSIWEAAGYPWSVRLKALLPAWMPWIRKRFKLSPKIEKQLLAISPRQMDRRLAAKKNQQRRRIYGRTKPGYLLKHHIPVKTDSWDVQSAGFTEVDLVSHSGNSGEGERCSLAGLARGVSASLDLLARAAGLRGAGRGCGAGADFSAEGGDRVRTAARALRGMRGRTEEKGTRWKAERCGR